MSENGKSKDDIIRVLIVNICDHYFGAPINEIHDVIRSQKTTFVPLTKPNIVGLLNLRGHIVTEIDMVKTLGIDVDSDEPAKREYSLVVNHNGELYSLVFDNIGDVIDISSTAIERLPETVNHQWASMSRGVYGLPDKLLVILDFKAIISELTTHSSIAV